MLGLVWWLIFGLIIGALARYLVPGEQPMSLLQTMLLGIAGSFLGGFIGFLIVGGSPLQAAGWIGSIVGAVVVLAIFVNRSKVNARASQ